MQSIVRSCRCFNLKCSAECLEAAGLSRGQLRVQGLRMFICARKELYGLVVGGIDSRAQREPSLLHSSAGSYNLECR